MSIEKLSRKNLFIFLASVGFTFGVIGCGIISTIISTVTIGDGNIHFCSPEFTKLIGDPTLAILIQVLVEGIYGIAAIGGTVVYYFEEWSLVRVTLTHYLLLVACFYMTSFFLKWFVFDTAFKFILSLILFTAVYMMIWLVFDLSYKAQIKQINEGLDRMKAAGNQEMVR